VNTDNEQNQQAWETPKKRSRSGPLTARAATALTALGLMGGGLAGGFIVSHAATSSSSSSTTTAPSSTTAPANGSTPGTFKPNEDPTHENGESAAREAQENAGQMPTVP
jgi:hypothetical protein